MLLLLCGFMTMCFQSQAQINYSQSFTGNAASWNAVWQSGVSCSSTGSITHTIAPNGFSWTTSAMTSPNIGGAANNGGNITVSYLYKTADNNSTSSSAAVGSFKVELQYAASTSGPWTTVQTIGNNYIPSKNCVQTSVIFQPALPAGSPLYLRYFVTCLSGNFNLTIDDIVVSQGPAPSACSGTPAIGSAIVSNPVIGNAGGEAELRLSSIPDESGISYQWESSGNGITYNNVPGAVTPQYYVTGLTADTWFRCVATCMSSSLSATSNPVKVTVITSPASFTVSRQDNVPYVSLATTGHAAKWDSAIAIGFPFAFRGHVYEKAYLNTQGYLSFAGGGWQGNSQQLVNKIQSNYFPAALITPFFNQLYTFVYPRYQVDGIAPNRVFTAEWNNMQNGYISGSVNFDHVSFQVKLYEGSNKIEFAYGAMDGFGRVQTGISTYIYPFYTYTAGLRGSTTNYIAQLAPNSDYFSASQPNDTLKMLPRCNSLVTFMPSATFSAGTAPTTAPPVNDNSANATALPVNAGPCEDNCGSHFSSLHATPSPEPSTCAATFDDDVWFTFTTTAVQNINIRILASGKYQPYASVLDGSLAALSGAGCINMQTSSASTSDNIVLNALPAGTYYLRVAAAGAGSGDGGFSICVSAPPANDECAGATPLTVTSGFQTSFAYGSFKQSSMSTGAPAPAGCSVTGTTDLWFTFTAPATGNAVVAVDRVNSGTNTYRLQALTGNCSGLSHLSCIGSQSNPRLYLTSLSPGSTIYIRAFGSSAGTDPEFRISVYDTTSSVKPPITPGGACVPQNMLVISPENDNLYTWSPIFDASGNIAAEIYPNGNVLGQVTTSVNVNTGTVRNNGSTYYMDRNLTITPDIQPRSGTGNNYPVSVRLYYTQAELAALNAANANPLASSLMIQKNNDPCSNTFTATASSLTPTGYAAYPGGGYVQISVPSFSSFYMIPAVPLPVSLLNFSGRNEGSRNLLSWKTAEEKEFSHFELQRSPDGNTYERIATVKGNSAHGGSYSYTDEQPFTGRNFYRLGMVDQDGSVALSSSVVMLTVASGDGLAINVYPNPVKQQLTVELNGLVAADARIEVLDMTGRILRSHRASAGSNILETSALPAGMYLVRYRDSMHHTMIKVIKD